MPPGQEPKLRQQLPRRQARLGFFLTDGAKISIAADQSGVGEIPKGGNFAGVRHPCCGTTTDVKYGINAVKVMTENARRFAISSASATG